MKTYICEYVKGGIECTISFDARSQACAEALARKEGWTITAVWHDEIPADVEAMIEKSVTQPRIH